MSIAPITKNKLAKKNDFRRPFKMPKEFSLSYPFDVATKNWFRK